MEKIDESSVFEAPTEDSVLPTEEDEAAFIEAAELGKATAAFIIMGNDIVLSTLTVKEVLQSAKIASEYRATQAEWLALKTAMVALAIDTINGEPFYTAISVSENVAQKRFNKLADNYYSDFISECYDKYKGLEQKQLDIIDKLKKA